MERISNWFELVGRTAIFTMVFGCVIYLMEIKGKTIHEFWLSLLLLACVSCWGVAPFLRDMENENKMKRFYGIKEKGGKC